MKAEMSTAYNNTNVSDSAAAQLSAGGTSKAGSYYKNFINNTLN